MSRTAVLIPARLGSVRLPNKPLADIGGVPMIARVYDAARAADVGFVGVVTDSAEIVSVIEARGGHAFLTDPDLPSGTDRVAQVFLTHNLLSPYERVINLQGDLPFFSHCDLEHVDALLNDDAFDIATLGAIDTDMNAFHDPNVVKIVASAHERLGPLYESGVYAGLKAQSGVLQAHSFTRAAAPHGAQQFLHHIGVYGFRRDALATFVALPPAPLERLERLEQLRALENGLSIGVALCAEVPLSVDTAEDLAAARRLV